MECTARSQQFAQSNETKQPLLDFVGKNYATILKSRAISEDECHYLSDLLDASFPDEKLERVLLTSYPRIWDESTRKADHAECCEVVADTFEHDVSTEREPIRFKTLDPEFVNHSGRLGKPRFANEIEWRLYDDNILFAEVIPEGDSKQASSIVRYIGIGDEMRLFKKGVVYLSCHSERTFHLRSPHADGVFTRWFESKGWTVKLSPAGRIAQQMLQQLQGVMGTELLAQEGIIQTLDKMNSSDEKSLSEKWVRGEIQKIANKAEFFNQSKREELLHRLVVSKVFQLGLKIQCPICTQFSWYSVKDADYELQCPECLRQFSFPSASKKVKWSYRTLGPFSSRNQAYGAYTVLLTLRFFSFITFSGSAKTPLLSFTAEKDGVEIEVDLALFFQESKFFHESKSQHSKIELIFAECKTLNAFQEGRC